MSQVKIKDKNGIFFVISAPSGTGKTTILRKVFSRHPDIKFSVSHTTRSPRKGEIDGEDYHYVTRESFLQMRDGKEFIEWAEVHGQYYGSSKSELEHAWDKELIPLFDIDPEGVMQIKDRISNGIYIFILPPSLLVD